MTGHTLTVEHDGFGVDVAVVCHDPPGAPCRLVCPQGCETWAQRHRHELVDAGECNAAAWINNDGCADCFGEGYPLRLRDGMPVQVEWTGKCYTWSSMRVVTG